jgi:hypothetical protein
VKLPLIRDDMEAKATKSRRSISGVGTVHYYGVDVETGRERGAGDLPECFINIMSSSTRQETGPLTMRPPAKEFTEGGVDSFRLESSVNVTDITHIDIGHRFAQGGWFVERVTVTNETTGQQLVFPCHRWLDRDRDDGKMTRTLRSGSPQRATAEYFVEVATGAQSTVQLAHAGVFVDISGAEGRTGRLQLSGPNARFQPSGVDTFTLRQQPDVGVMDALDLGYSGEGGKWHCDWIQVTNTTTGDVAFFPADIILSSEQPLMQCVASQTDRMGNPRRSIAAMTGQLPTNCPPPSQADSVPSHHGTLQYMA